MGKEGFFPLLTKRTHSIAVGGESMTETTKYTYHEACTPRTANAVHT